MPSIFFTHDTEANRLLEDNPFALITGLVLYQQVPVEKAFDGPRALRERLGGNLDAATVASMDPDVLETVFREKPALHRFPANMAKRVRAVAEYVVAEYDGKTEALWSNARSGKELMGNLTALPGFGDYKARVAIGVLSKYYGVQPNGYEEFVPDWPSIADIDKPEDIEDLKVRKKAWKESSGG